MDTPDEPWGSTRTPSLRPSPKSTRSLRSTRSDRSPHATNSTEQTPLLARDDAHDSHDDSDSDHDSDHGGRRTPAAASLLRSLSSSSVTKIPFWRRRWASILALTVLCTVFVFVILGFLASEGIDEYAIQAAQFQPTTFALDSLSDQGANVRIEGDFFMDAARVRKQSVRNFGRFGTWIAREVETGPTDVNVYLPEYDDLLIGTAHVPGIKVNIRNGHTTHLAFVATLQPGPPEGIRNVAYDWLKGRLGQVRVRGKAEVAVKSGLISLGRQTVEHSMVFKSGDVPALPKYNITKLNLREANHGQKGLSADASIVVANQFPVQLDLPAVAVDVLIDGCVPSDKHLKVGTAQTDVLEVRPETDIHVNVTGNVEKLTETITDVCPNSEKSPLDAFIGDYMKGEDATIYINCCRFPDPAAPQWARDLLKDITVPAAFASREMGSLIKNFSMADLHFSLPDPFADEGTPEAAPKISATVKVDISLPEEMNFPVDVDRVRADADIFYHNKLLGKMNLKKWQDANSTRIEGNGKEKPSLLVQSKIVRAPIDIVDSDLFSEVVQALIFGDKAIMMDMKALVSVGVDTPMGNIAVRGIPAEGVVPVKPIRHDTGNGDNPTGKLNFSAGGLSIVETTPTSMTMQVHVNFTNPTNYSAAVPYFNLNVLANDTVLAQVIAKDIEVRPGRNTDLVMSAVWDPYTNSGNKGKEVGSELLSQYISGKDIGPGKYPADSPGYNTSITIQAHKGTIPTQPALGRVLSQFPYTLPAPHLSNPNDDPNNPDDHPHFIRSTTMHILSSTAIFTLASPFRSTTLFITDLNATAFYKDHPAGKILYDIPFAVRPGLSDSPRLPVDWSFGSMGYDAVRRALGGTLKLKAFAWVGIKIGEWEERIWFQGREIGANIRL